MQGGRGHGRADSVRLGAADAHPRRLRPAPRLAPRRRRPAPPRAARAAARGARGRRPARAPRRRPRAARRPRSATALDAAGPVFATLGARARRRRRGRARRRQPRPRARRAAGSTRASRPSRRASSASRSASRRPSAGPLAARAGRARGRRAASTVAYPGMWLRDDVYATHGHYLDPHATVPTFERLGAGAMARWPARLPEPPRRPTTTRRVARAALRLDRTRSPSARRTAQAGARRRARRASGGRWQGSGAAAVAAPRGAGRRRARSASAWPTAPASGPCAADLSGAALRRGGLRGMGEVVARASASARRHVVFGHTHRAGPVAARRPAEWRRRQRRPGSLNTRLLGLPAALPRAPRDRASLPAGRRGRSSTDGAPPPVLLRLLGGARARPQPGASPGVKQVAGTVTPAPTSSSSTPAVARRARRRRARRGPSTAHAAAVDARRSPAPSSDRPHRRRPRRARLGALLVGGRHDDAARPASSSGRRRRTGSPSTPSSSWIARSVSA